MVNPHLPQPTALRCRQITIQPDLVTITTETIAPTGACPNCGRLSSRIHSHYSRRLGDLPWQGRAVRLLLLSRKFFCGFPTCSRRIFTERLPEVVDRYARTTTRLQTTRSDIAFACGGEGGSRLAARLGMPVSPDTLLRVIRRTWHARTSSTRILGVDDWAVRKGMRYGTLLCDLEQHRPIDLLDDREPETFAAWLREHPEVEVITRDRAHCFAEGAKLGAPQAMQVADRFHLMQNLREALVRMLDRCQGQMALAMRDAVSSRDPPEQPTTQAPATTARTTGIPRAPTHREVRRDRRIARYDKVMDMHIQGISQRSIARQLKMNRATVGRYIHAGQFPERAARRYESKADRFIDYLQQRWGEGCHSAAQLTRELKRLGFKGSYCSVKRRVARWEKCSDAPSARSMDKQAPSAKRTAWMILKSPDGLNEDERGFLSALEHRCPDIALAVQLAGEFVSMVHREGNSTLQTWIPCAQDKAVPMALRHFATGLKADYRAVEAGLTTEWSNGQLEGQVNRLKLIKRQMYGRAKFDLLRQRVLHAN